MKLPNGDRAQISLQKLAGYCLNPTHEREKDKARRFKAILGITAGNADRLYALVQQAAIEGEVIQQVTTPFGQQFKVDWVVPDTAEVQLRTLWEIAPDSVEPRLISAFIKR
ncbi:MAG TPA: hypothetical protein V6C57_14190 [Coleofasciculaceae cyanobacterium]